MTMRFTNTITIERSRGDVFEFLARFENVPRWNYAISETRKVSRGPTGVGSRYVQTRTVPALSQETFEVTEFEPGSKLSVQGTLGRFPARLTYVLEPIANGTRLTNAVDLEPSGLLGLIAPLATAKVKSAVAENLSTLKKILE